MSYNHRVKHSLDKRSILLRQSMVDMFGVARRGHLGSAFSIAEIVRVLYDDVMAIDPHRPDWNGRDRCILSKGHGCLALYAMLLDKGFIGESDAKSFCKADGLLGGHQSFHIPGVEVSTGSLGHGLSLGVGMALVAKMDHASHRIFVLLGDGEMDEGSVWEAALSAAKHRLDNLVVLVDVNGMQSYGTTDEVLPLIPIREKWKSFGFGVHGVDGHDVTKLRKLLLRIGKNQGKPVVVLCRTIKGKGIPSIENSASWHHRRGVTDGEMAVLRRDLEENV